MRPRLAPESRGEAPGVGVASQFGLSELQRGRLCPLPMPYCSAGRTTPEESLTISIEASSRAALFYLSEALLRL